jgi:trehalose/maltose hydrolase-like predicted phosphorylase
VGPSRGGAHGGRVAGVRSPSPAASALEGRREPDRTFAAVVVHWDEAAEGGPVSDGLVDRLRALCRAGVSMVVVTRADVAMVDDRLSCAPHGVGRLYLVSGSPPELHRMTRNGPALVARPRDQRDVMPAVLDALATDGIGPGLVLVLGDPHARGADRADRQDRGGPGLVWSSSPPLRVLTGLLQRIRTHRVPSVDVDPRWTVVETGPDRMRHRVIESLTCLASGAMSVRGSVEENGSDAMPLVAVAGVYAGNASEDGLLAGPDLVGMPILRPPERDRHLLDLRSGVLIREELDCWPPLRSARFASLQVPALYAQRVEATPERLGPFAVGEAWEESPHRAGARIAVLRQDSRWDGDDVSTLERLALVLARPGGLDGDLDGGRDDTTREPGPLTPPVTRPRRVASHGFDELLVEQRRRWADRWRSVCVDIPDAPDDELGLRFALFQLWSLSGAPAELAVGAKGLTGDGYSGHVFWDADVFVLPALVTVDPDAARRMVDYRLNRLDAARRRAHAEGRPGARFPWESALSGDDVTPREGRLGGEQIAILTGKLEDHITADVAWSVIRRASWAREDAALTDTERLLLAETARYWLARCRRDDDDRLHIDGVIGPDEYHEGVDDNAYTNVMARWNLATAADRVDDLATEEEKDEWRDAAHHLVDGYDPRTGVYEQFRGYLDLEQLTVDDVGRTPVAADMVFGRARVSGAQLVKQADVLMLHHLVPDAVVAGSLAPNLDFYLPRTVHGSSLSPAIHASLLARAGRPGEALELLRIALRVDLDDRGGTTAAGIHLGAVGGAWQALLFGFLGVQVTAGIVCLDPVLPAAWPRLEVRFRCLGHDLTVTLDQDAATMILSSSGRVRVRVGDRPVVVLDGGHRPWNLVWHEAGVSR